VGMGRQIAVGLSRLERHCSAFLLAISSETYEASTSYYMAIRSPSSAFQ